MITNKDGIGTVFIALLLVSLALVPAVSANAVNQSDQGVQSLASGSTGQAVNQKTSYPHNGIVTSTVSQASLSVDKSTGTKGSTFYFKGKGSFTAEVYGVPLPDLLWFANDINYKAFNKPVLLSASDPSSYYYTTSTPITEGAWTQRYFMSMLGGPVTKSVYCKAVSRNKGTYASRQYAGLTLVGGSNQYVYTTIK
jgi:hypothetical protein